MSRVMLTAGEARTKALQDIIVLREIRDIEEAILTAAADGQMEAEISDSTMTISDIGNPGYALATEYFDTWAGTRDDRQKSAQMDKIIKYFSDLGYAINRRANPSTGSTFMWAVAW